MSGLYKFFPTPSDKMGILWALSTIKGAYIIEYGPGGTTHYSMEGIFKINGEILANTYTTHIDEDDVVMGDTEKLRKTILEVDQVYRPPYIFVIASSLVSVIGTDVHGAVHALKEQVNAKIITYQSGGFQGDYTMGVRRVLADLAEHVVQPAECSTERTYNLIGCCVDDYRYAANIKAIQSVLSDALGLRCQCVFTAGCTVQEIESASAASLNIVLRHEGRACAAMLAQRFGTPYVHAHPIGYQATMDMIAAVAEALNLVPDRQYMDAQRNRARRSLMQVKGHLRRAERTSTVMSGGYDAVAAYSRFLGDELGLRIDAALVHHACPEGAQDPFLYKATEADKQAAISKHNPAFLFGDAVLLHAAVHPCFKLQTQNPNLRRVMITTHKPHMGFDGADDIVEQLLNGTI